MFCAKCGKEIKDGINFCSSCGTKLNSTTAENTQVNLEKNKSKDIKCGNCEYIGPGESARKIAAIILAWLCVFFAPIITILYFAITNKYRCPKCHSNFIGMKNKEGIYVSQKKGNILLIVVMILVAIAVVGLLSTLAVVALNNARMKARDAKRVSDIKQIQTAAELYYNDTDEYPLEIIPAQKIEYKGTVYMSSTPTNPIPNDGYCPSDFEYKYTPSINGKSYTLDFCLGGDIGGMKAGFNMATPEGISTNDSFNKIFNK